MGDRIVKDLVIKAMEMALRKEDPGTGLIFHSDRGSQYCSNDFKDLLKSNRIRQSMSRRETHMTMPVLKISLAT